jgi:EAL domain-containing protein (putative c-di-GMP-specific phosphodiesterase class I)/FixJ family two-component response regulator/GGDEF domain-containing protein
MLERLNRLYSMLSHINRAIIRAESPNDIYSAACQIAVEEGNCRFAIIALMEPQVQKLIAVASAGTSIDLDDLPPCILAAGQGKPCIVNNVYTDKRAAWTGSTTLEETGILSVASFPLFLEQSEVGTFTVGVGEAHYFGEAELHLLEEVSADISFAMDILHRDEKRLAGEAKMHYLAYYDARTGLPCRPLFEERLATICEHYPATVVCVMAINLRNYHERLQLLGENAGITIARSVASRIETVVPTAIVARIGEAEFALALESQKELREIEETARQIHRSITEAISVDKQEVFLEALVGIAMFPKDGVPAEVVKSALTAADTAPPNSGSCCRVFVSGMDKLSRSRLDLDTALRHAISRQEFELYYQPQVDLVSGRVVGAEALLRWQRPNIGLVQPSEFIPMLEETGLINAVGEWALFEACAACRRWQDQGLPPVRVAVNLSGRQFRNVDIEVLVRRVLHDTHLDPHWLELEVTENSILPNAAKIIRILRDLKASGVSQALDDFGTGYSSLSYLQRLPVQRLKVDRSFVANITSNPGDAAIVRAVVSMAHSLGIRVIAEGAETEGQLGYLRGLTCDEMQGYHFSPPLPENDFVTLLRDGRCIQIETDQPKHERVLLLVDDDPNIRSTLRSMLRRTDIHLLTTTNPNKGFELLATNRVGVVVCDQRMPEMTGTEFLRRVKELFPTTVRIVLSGYTDLDSVIDAVNRGAVYKFLTKPLQAATLLESLEDAFHLHEIERENLLLTHQLNELVAAAKTSEGASYLR